MDPKILIENEEKRISRKLIGMDVIEHLHS